MPAMPDPSRLLIVAVSGRALAQSAVRGGYRPVVLDLFADRDTRAASIGWRRVSVPGSLRLDPPAVLRAARTLAPGAGLVYGSGFEGRTGLLERLGRGRTLYGNQPSTVALIRDPVRFFPLLRRLGIRHPPVRFSPPRSPGGWLVKGPGGAGGTRVRPATSGPPAKTDYYQRFESGDTLSAAFLADGRRALVLGINRQWTAPRPGGPYLYGGAVGGLRIDDHVRREIEDALDTVVAETGLVGLNGLDFILRDGRWLVLELNPRPTATFELYDPDYSRGLFHWHLRACRGELPVRTATLRAVRAHAVVHASGAAKADGVRFPRWCRDLPVAGTRFAPGDPICTVHASAPDAPRALALVRGRAHAIERAVV
jgi:predicted ATP-grasp superfamily ATP-dependent carboligase